MKTYYDSGVVLKTVLLEPLTPVVTAFLAQRQAFIPYTVLVELECENVLHAKYYRQDITAAQLAQCLGMLRQYERTGQLCRITQDLTEVYAQARQLTTLVTSTTGCRTLDLLHIASALKLGCQEMVSTDQRQLAAAQSAGLTILNLENWTPPTRSVK